jgi:hypothetical protein
MTDKLLDCPFCGGAPHLFEGYWVECTKCGCQTPETFEEVVISAWNRRTPPAAVPDGWVMVPRAVSSKMLEAAQEAVILGETEDGSPARLSYREAEECYRAMISAAPAPPTEASDE